MLHCQDGKADCQDVLYIFSVRIDVSHDIDMAKIVSSQIVTNRKGMSPALCS